MSLWFYVGALGQLGPWVHLSAPITFKLQLHVFPVRFFKIDELLIGWFFRQMGSKHIAMIPNRFI
jgi:hypothetical protein